jgi:hypothetical protein
MKKPYEQPIVVVSIFNKENMITASGTVEPEEVVGGLTEVNHNGSTAWIPDWNQ